VAGFWKHPLLGIAAALLGTAPTILLCAREARLRVVTLEYRLTDHARATFVSLIEGFNHLAGCSAVWVKDQGQHLVTDHDRKVNAGAAELVKVTRIGVGDGAPKWLQTNVPVPTMRIHDTTLHLFPDFVLVKDAAGLGALDYQDLSVTWGTTRMVEEVAPSDAQVVDTTWKFANKHGGPDKRFNNNRELPVCLYGTLRLTASGNRHLALLQTSKVDAAKAVGEALERMAQDLSVIQATALPTVPELKVAAEPGPNISRRPGSTSATSPVLSSAAEAALVHQVEMEERERLAAFKSGSGTRHRPGK
jgi:hypothetical protein